MKNIKMIFIAVLFAFLTQSIVGAIQVNNIAGQKEVNKSSAQQASALDYVQKFETLTNRYYDDLRTCVPLHFNQYLDIFGLKLGLNFDINGWNNGKCEYRMGFNLDSLGKDIREVFNIKITDEQLEKINPRVECNFTQEELNMAVDVLIARSQKNTEHLREVLKNPNEKYVSNTKTQKLTKEEEQLIALLTKNNACSIPNKDELMTQITELMYKQ